MRLALIMLLLAGCSSRAGMSCQADGECATGLHCVRPPRASGVDMGPLGVCEPARRGLGAVCLWSSECNQGLLCSNQTGAFSEDGRHGTCQPAPVDAAVAPDQSAPAGDGGALDGGLLDGGEPRG